MLDKLIFLFCSVDDFIKEIENQGLKRLGSSKKRGPKSKLSLSEILTIYILYHSSNFRNFKSYYLAFKNDYKEYFPNLVSYNRFVELIPYTLPVLTIYLYSLMKKPSIANFIDSTSIKICKNKRIKRNKVFKGLARQGKTTVGWFHGFKLHIIVNEYGELLAFSITPGNVSDINPVFKMCEMFKIKGKIFGDKGYISSELFEKLFNKGVHLFTTLRRNMKNKLMETYTKIMLRKRSIIETINDQLKNISDI
jgi:hypothetical protein